MIDQFSVNIIHLSIEISAGRSGSLCRLSSDCFLQHRCHGTVSVFRGTADRESSCSPSHSSLFTSFAHCRTISCRNSRKSLRVRSRPLPDPRYRSREQEQSTCPRRHGLINHAVFKEAEADNQRDKNERRVLLARREKERERESLARFRR